MAIENFISSLRCFLFLMFSAFRSLASFLDDSSSLFRRSFAAYERCGDLGFGFSGPNLRDHPHFFNHGLFPLGFGAFGTSRMVVSDGPQMDSHR